MNEHPGPIEVVTKVTLWLSAVLLASTLTPAHFQVDGATICGLRICDCQHCY